MKKKRQKKKGDKGMKHSWCERKKYKRRRREKRGEKRLKRAPEPLKIKEAFELWK